MAEQRNADKPASPTQTFEELRDGPVTLTECDGLTKREYFAAMAMQGLIANAQPDDIAETRTAWQAVNHADALLAELEKE